MRIIGISDTHGEHERLSLPPGDVLVHSGDWTKRGREKEVNDFLAWFESQPFDYKVLICGNHELDPAAKLVMLWAAYQAGIYYLEDSSCFVHGFKFYGSPWTPAFYNWNFMTHSATQRKRIWDQIPADTDVLITHGPPFGILDRNDDGQCCGDYTLAEKTFEIKPKVHIFGHIHEARGEEKVDDTRYFNICTLDSDYRLVRPAVIIDV